MHKNVPCRWRWRIWFKHFQWWKMISLAYPWTSRIVLQWIVCFETFLILLTKSSCKLEYLRDGYGDGGVSDQFQCIQKFVWSVFMIIQWKKHQELWENMDFENGVFEISIMEFLCETWCVWVLSPWCPFIDIWFWS